MSRAVIGAAAVAGTAGMAEAGIVAPFQPVLERVEIFLPRLPLQFDGVRIILLSDLHIQPGFDVTCLRPAHELAAQAAGDLILSAGDYRNDHAYHGDEEIIQCADFIASLSHKARFGAVAIYGNHDYPKPPEQPDESVFTSRGVSILRNKTADLTHEGAMLHIVGLDSLIKRPADPSFIAGLPKGSCSIVLWHEPDWAQRTAYTGASLQLSGHTHGGQVVLPLIGPPILPKFGKLYPSGQFRVGQMVLYVSRGVGLMPPRVRVNCPPEVTEITLRRGVRPGRATV